MHEQVASVKDARAEYQHGRHRGALAVRDDSRLALLSIAMENDGELVFRSGAATSQQPVTSTWKLRSRWASSSHLEHDALRRDPRAD